MAERRGASRISVNLSARYRSDTLTLSGKVANLSRHGLFLLTDVCDGSGADAELTLDLPDAPSPLSLKGRVVRVDTPGMAIQFQHLAAAESRLLANFMIEHSSAVDPIV